MKTYHKPVLLLEVIELLNIKQDDIILDATIGEGGHSEQFIKIIGPKGFLIGIDLDEEALAKAYERLSKISSNFTLINGNFKDLDKLLPCAFLKVDKILLDLGVSSLELDIAERGFSFMRDSILDMRMNRKAKLTAKDIVNFYPEEDISNIIYNYGEERHSRKIAHIIVEERRRSKILTTKQLAEICKRSYPPGHYRIHPATKTFQALRIYVNDELSNLKEFFEKAPDILSLYGRIAVISYHSLEDRIVKNYFKNSAKLRVLTKKPVRPKEEEFRANSRARSAKLRVAERI